jgi:hypothetical protein
VAKADLPPEMERTSLEYVELISTLELIDGEPVIVRLSPREADQGPAAGLASIVGELRHRVTARYEGYEFAIGNPYPDCDRGPVAGGILFLDEATFQNASLRTFDGNDYFSISITTRSMEILIQDIDSTYP